MAINNGKGSQYKGKSLDEIEFSDNIDSDDSDDSHDEDFAHRKRNTNACLTSKKAVNDIFEDTPNSESTSNNDMPGPSKLYNSISSQSVTETQDAYVDGSDLDCTRGKKI